jgi:hypothetical protein
MRRAAPRHRRRCRSRCACAPRPSRRRGRRGRARCGRGCTARRQHHAGEHIPLDLEPAVGAFAEQVARHGVAGADQARQQHEPIGDDPEPGVHPVDGAADLEQSNHVSPWRAAVSNAAFPWLECISCIQTIPLTPRCRESSIANWAEDPLAADLPVRGLSAAGHAHVAGHRRPLVAAVDDEVVTLGLARDGLLDRPVEHLIGRGSAQHRAEVGGVLLPEAHE